MDMKENVVILALASYNVLKSENQKFNLFMDRLFEYAELREDYGGLTFNLKDIDELVHLCYPDRYKKKLSSLRGQQTKLSMQKLEWEKEKEDNDDGKSESPSTL